MTDGGEADRLPDYLAFGDLGVDSVATIDHLPEPDEKIWADPVGDFPGGMMGNAAAAVASLGVSAGVVALLGADARGDVVVDGLQGRGVDTRFVRRIEAPTFWTLSLTTSQGERTLIQFPTVAFSADWTGFDMGLLGATKWVHTTAEQGEPVDRLLREARAVGVGTSLDIEAPFAGRPDLLQLAANADVAFLNAAAADMLGGPDAAAAVLRDSGAGLVAVTLGSRGALVVGRSGEQRRLDALPVDAVDTNGAGDAFAGALVAGLLNGLADLEAAELAVIHAAMSITVPGGFGRPHPLGEIRDTARELGYPWWERL